MEKYPDASRVSGVRISSVAKMKGISKTSQKPYEFIAVEYLVPQRDFSNANVDRQAFGFKFMQINAILDDALFEDLKSLKFLEPATIYLASMPDDMTKNHIVGVEQDLTYVATPAKSEKASDKQDKFQ